MARILTVFAVFTAALIAGVFYLHSSRAPQTAHRFPITEASAWVDIWQPQRSSPGYNLMLYERRTPFLMDMDGTVVHSWPDVRMAGRARLQPNGDLIGIGADNSVLRYDWSGTLLFRYQPSEKRTLPHHDLIELRNGNLLTLWHNRGKEWLLELTPGGNIAWRWEADLLLKLYPDRATDKTDPTHINSLEELDNNRWHESGDLRFKPGNILLSVRNLNMLLIVDKESGNVVWDYAQALDAQHEARMLRAPHPRAGNIQLFDNGLENKKRWRTSEIREINPLTGEVAWQYSDRHFFSSTSGIQQMLQRGTVLITESNGGRVFEVTEKGEIVWQVIPPYLEMRVLRYPYDYSRLFEDLPRAAEVEITSPEDGPFTSVMKSSFSHKSEEGRTRKKRIGERELQVLRKKNTCSKILIPSSADMSLSFGAYPKDLTSRKMGQVSAAMKVWIEEEDGEEKMLLDERSIFTPELWIADKAIDLRAFALKEPLLCVSVSGNTPEDTDVLFVTAPEVRRTNYVRHLIPLQTKAAESELEADLLRLRSLGYVN